MVANADPRQNFPDRALYTLDNLAALRGMNSETVDLIATDPPFNTSRNRAGTAGFYVDKWKWGDTGILPDQWKWNEVHPIWLEQVRDENRALHEVIEAAGQCHGEDIAAFLCFLSVRLLEMHRILKPTGSLYLHCDHAANGYIRMALDAIFGARNLRNEIVWLRRQDRHNLARRQMGNAHDTIFWYAKSKDAHYNIQYEPYTDEYIRTAYNKVDARGQYRTLPCTNETGGNKVYEFRGITRAWRFTPEHMEELYQNDMLVQATPTSPFQYKKYLDLNQGVKIQDVWDKVGGARGKERTGAPDQKPLELYERIVRASSNPGDLVLDPFCGCATTLIAAHNLGRRWVGIDRRADAAFHIANRLLGLGINVDEFQAQQQILMRELQSHCEILDVPPVRTDDGENYPPLAAVYTYRRRPASMTRQQMLDLLTRQWGVVCWGCGFEPPDAEHLELDHIDPASQGGSNELDNRCPLCGPCNKRKSNRLTLVALRQLNRRLGKWYGNPPIDRRIDIRLARDWAAQYLETRARQGNLAVMAD